MTRLPETAKPLGSLGVGMKVADGVTGPNCRTSRWRVMLVVLVGRLVSRGQREVGDPEQLRQGRWVGTD